MSTAAARKMTYGGFAIVSSAVAAVILVRIGNPVTLVVVASLISLTAAPLLYGFNLYCVTRHIREPEFRPAAVTVVIAVTGVLFMLIALAATAYVKLGPLLASFG
jgi:hypothetical protein